MSEIEPEPEFSIRPLAPGELGFCLDLAAAEGWNPGLHDAVALAAADPDGFFAGMLGEEKIGCISAVRYEGFGMAGFHLVREPWRGQGYGRKLWERALEHLGSLPVGVDVPLAACEPYVRAGFAQAHTIVRYQSDAREPRDHFESKIALVNLRGIEPDLLAYDRACFGTPREKFLQAWIWQPDAVAIGARTLETGALLGFGVGRPCRDGTKIGPLFASRLDVAILLFDTIVLRTRSPWFLDVPSNNHVALGVADDRGMKKTSETARMWRGDPPHIASERIYGVTSLELG